MLRLILGAFGFLALGTVPAVVLGRMLVSVAAQGVTGPAVSTLQRGVEQVLDVLEGARVDVHGVTRIAAPRLFADTSSDDGAEEALVEQLGREVPRDAVWYAFDVTIAPKPGAQRETWDAGGLSLSFVRAGSTARETMGLACFRIYEDGELVEVDDPSFAGETRLLFLAPLPMRARTARLVYTGASPLAEITLPAPPSRPRLVA